MVIKMNEEKEREQVRLTMLKEAQQILETVKGELREISSGFIENEVNNLAAEMTRTVQHYTYILNETLSAEVRRREKKQQKKHEIVKEPDGVLGNEFEMGRDIDYSMTRMR